eukprot:CAMPEP_0174386734 /NCGR_PEP_ID=MMETSP0811_2-20130205/127475_1 /TAXON_ID=73025 ORGANISM="Eutreptiella gymnastica-like, Strain CCMP1594" /NCGR_SAMPLE_ID=MMETSP0811_2 /ASSEMBLY_ACC=CAM_ASM_000667 /LENGTH=93 /DNA_ID=CAMNT_0015541513 /DNA_START=712 /DNA_END=993 /DNA_ORIENTATION=+
MYHADTLGFTSQSASLPPCGVRQGEATGPQSPTCRLSLADRGYQHAFDKMGGLLNWRVSLPQVMPPMHMNLARRLHTGRTILTWGAGVKKSTD